MILAHFDKPIILIGGGRYVPLVLQKYVSRGYPLIGVDKGADSLYDIGLTPDHIIGDLDSLESESDWPDETRLHRISEQNTTDFEKALYSFDAPLFLCFGFTGRRMDHTLASFHTQLKYSAEKNIILCNINDAAFIARGNSEFTVEKDSIFSIFPFVPVSFKSSKGLKYPLTDITMEIGSQIGTSNQTTGTKVSISTTEGAQTPYGVILPTKCLDTQIEAMI